METATEDKKLFLLDAFALIYRAYFALNNSRHFNPINSKGLNTAAILGFTNTLVDLLKNQDPSHIAVVFDAPSATVRHVEYSDYKANREEMPEDIRLALPYIREVIDAFNIPAIASEGYEADDVIGTLAKKAEKEGYSTYMMTPDKDFGQLVSENIFMYKPARMGNAVEVWGVKEVCEKFEIDDPLQVIDILGMWGDAVDNIPGIPGVGEKTAKKLVQQYGSMEGLYEHTDELKGKLKEKVEDNKEQAFMSKRLATIITDAPVDFDEEQLRRKDPNEEKIHELFSELEFRTLAKRVLSKEIKSTAPNQQMDLFGDNTGGATEALTEEEAVSEFKTAENTPHNYIQADSPAAIDDLITKLEACDSICFDTETTGIDPLTAEMVGLSFCIEAGTAYYVPTSANQDEARTLVQRFRHIFENENKEFIAHNMKYDLKMLHRYGVDIKGRLFDTMIAHYLLQPDMKHNMDVLAETFLNYKPISIETLIGKKGKNQLTMREVDVAQVTEYAAEDADITFQLKQVFQPDIENDHLKKLFHEIEMPLVKVLASMEEEGIRLDVKTMNEFSAELQNDIDRLSKEILDLAGTSFNIDSPKQLGQVLFEVMEITDKAPKTKTGQYSTSEDVLSKLKHSHEIIPKILDYRSVKKLKSTYADTLPEQVNADSGRIHTTYSQSITATGRLSSNNPNLQNIPIRTARGREIRKSFTPRNNDYTLLSADYSQIELRIIAALSEDPSMKEAFKQSADIHSATAAKVYGVGMDEVDREMRSKAKEVNFGLAYGMSAFGLSQRLNIPRKEASELIKNYFEQYPGIKEFMEKSVAFAKEKGFVETIKNRRRYLRDINSSNAVVRGAAERNAINAPIQGSAADIIKVAMININEKLAEKPYQSKMLLQVHDELVFDVHKSELDEIKELVRSEMENAVQLDVPLVVEMDAADNWLDAH